MAVGEVWGAAEAGGASAAAVTGDPGAEARRKHVISASLVAAVLILGLCCGRWQAENSAQVGAHAGPPGGWLTESPRGAHPMFGAGAATRTGTGDPTMRRTSSPTAAALATTITAAMSAGALAGDPVQWRVVDGGNGHWYQLRYVSTGLTFDQAQSIATSVGAHLAAVTSSAENEWIKTNAAVPNPTGTIWGPSVGGRKINGTWTWVTGEPWNFSAWGASEPTGDGPILQYWRYGSLWWNDNTDGNDKWIIEWDADCNSDGIVDYGQILTGAVVDADSNGIPDTCECATNPSLPSCCPGDIYRNGRVDGADLGALLSEWGPVTPLTNSDLDGNGEVNGADLGILLSHWGPCGG